MNAKRKRADKNIQSIAVNVNRINDLIDNSCNVSESDVTVIGGLLRIARKFAIDRSQCSLQNMEAENKEMEQSLIDLSMLMEVIEEKVDHLSNIAYLEYIVDDVKDGIKSLIENSKSKTNGK